jgi:hypothetical protein
MNDITYNKICLMTPTYGRSTTYLPTFIDSALKTWDSQKPISFAFCVNIRDQATREYLRSVDFKGCEWWIADECLPKPNLGAFFNTLYGSLKSRNEPATIATMLGDDMEFRTHGWNIHMLDLINQYQGIGPFWCDDDFIARERCPVNLFVSQQFVDATERPFMCEQFQGDMIDWIWAKVGKYTRTSHFHPEVHIFHNHDGSKEHPDATSKRLLPSKQQGHAVGKGRARQIAADIAEILKRKGLVGDSIC